MNENFSDCTATLLVFEYSALHETSAGRFSRIVDLRATLGSETGPSASLQCRA
jgi:hypothetical protein